MPSVLKFAPSILTNILTVSCSRKLASQSLSLYSETPFQEITIDEFETYALDRLQLLRCIEQVTLST